MKATTKVAKKATKTAGTFSAEEKAAMKERAKEAKAGKADGEADLKAKIAEMKGSDREIAEKIDAIVRKVAPDLKPKTWYGMPAWANAEDKVVCFFTPAAKFKERYASFGFNTAAKLDDGSMWATSWAVTKLSKDDEAKLAALVKKAAG
jgi:uncharacterized protein YdhG (YjbR/CyaY superfamily)